ncbi:hypothetical protein [Streptomyces xantholiticus]|uniref:Uncharacterized protein n=1 Tax=Streptomyces xantholiticus TaxID=68285 RepID=A0ABV1UYS3_9ACTN
MIAVSYASSLSQVGDEVTVAVDEMDRQRRRLTLFRRPTPHDLR